MAIILKRGLEANRASTAVAEGEMLFSRDTGRLYIGSGSSNLGGQEINFNNLTASAIIVQNSESISRITLLSHGTVANADSIFVGRVASGTPISASSTLQGHYTAWQMQTWGTSSWSTTARMMMQAAENHNDASRPTNIIFATVASGSSTLGDRFKINGVGVQVTGSLGVTTDITVGGSVTVGTTLDISPSSATLNLGVGSAAGTRQIVFGSTYNAGSISIVNGLTTIASIAATGILSNVGFRAGVGSGPTAVDYGWSGASGFYSPTANNISVANNNARVANFSTTALTLDYTTSATAATAGAFLVGNGVAATNVAIGGGNINAGGNGTFGGNLTVNGLTASRVPYVGTNGAIVDSSSFTFAGGTLSVTSISASQNISTVNVTASNVVMIGGNADTTYGTTGKLQVWGITRNVAPGEGTTSVYARLSTFSPFNFRHLHKDYMGNTANQVSERWVKEVNGAETTIMQLTDGDLSVTSSIRQGTYSGGVLGARVDVDGNTYGGLSNQSTGGSARVGWNIDNGAYTIGAEMMSQGFTTVGPRVANRGYFFSDGAAGTTLHSINGTLRFWTGNTGTERMTITTGGDVNITSTTSATTATAGALTIGNGVAATSVAIGGGKIFVGSDINVGGNIVAVGNITASALYVDAAVFNALTMSVDTLTVNVMMNGTASYAITSATASFVLTSSYAITSATSSITTTASFARTASYVVTALTASVAGTASYVLYSSIAGSPALVSSSAQFTASDIFTIGQMTVTQLTASNLYVDTANFNTLTMSADIVIVSGSVSASVVRDTYGNVRSIPQNWEPAAYTMSLIDVGQHVYTTSSVLIPTSVFSTGDVSMVVNSGSGDVSIVTGSGVTFRLAGSAATGNRTLSNYGSATVMCVAPNLFYLSGAGLT